MDEVLSAQQGTAPDFATLYSAKRVSFTIIPYEYSCDIISVLRWLKTEDLGLKHTKPITSYQSVSPGTLSIHLDDVL